MQLPKGQGETGTEEQVSQGGGEGGTAFRKKNKRKSGQKSRLLQKAKKFAKQGKLGRGYEVDTATYNYFVQVLELWQKNEFENEEERATFVENSFAQTEGNEVNYSSNQMTSRVLETILPSASEGVLLRFGAAFAPSLRTLCADPFASHVVEKLLEVASSEKWASESPTKVSEWFRSTAKYVLNNLEEFTFDPYANHVMRKVCQCLTGFVQETGQAAVQQQNTGVRPKPGRKSGGGTLLFGERALNKKNIEIFTNFYASFLAWPQFYDLFNAELTSGFVQTVLKTAARISDSPQHGLNLVEGIKKVCEALGPSLDLTNATHASLYTRMLEVCLPLSGSTWEYIFNRYFSGKLVPFGIHEKGKFCLKKVIETCPSKEQFETIFDEIHPAFGSVFEAKATSLFTSVSEGCKTFGTRQSQFIQSLSDLIDSNSNEDSGAVVENNFISKLAMFGGQLELKGDGTPKYITQFVGTMIIQNLMEFHKPLKVVSSMLEMEGSNLSKLATDPKGSHIFDAFFKSGTIGDKNKEKMWNKLKEYMVPLALNKFGSRVIDTIWDWGSLKQKSILAGSLADRVPQLNASPFGKFIVEKMSLHVFKRDPKLWGESLEKGGKREREAKDVLDEFLGDDGVEESGKKSKKKKNKHVAEEEEVIVEQEEGEQVEEEGGKRKKKKKNKNKVVEDEEQEVAEEAMQEEEEETPKKKSKKKKRKHQGDDNDNAEGGESIIPDSTTTNVDDEPEKKKKKKKDRKNRESE